MERENSVAVLICPAYPNPRSVDDDPEPDPIGRNGRLIDGILELLWEFLAEPRPVEVGHAHVLNRVVAPDGIVGPEIERPKMHRS
jgi:hypothetical protein